MLIILIGGVVSGFLLLPNIGLSALQRGENARLEVWSKFLSLALLRPIFGYGEKIEFHVEIRNAEIIGHAHNLYLSAFTRGGIFACAFLIAAITLSIKYSLKYAKVYVNKIPLCAVTTIAISGIVDFDLIVFLTDWQWPSFWFPMGLIMAAEQKIKESS
jgi:O-antigen ligase